MKYKIGYSSLATISKNIEFEFDSKHQSSIGFQDILLFVLIYFYKSI
jgi:hypothetical protein